MDPATAAAAAKAGDRLLDEHGLAGIVILGLFMVAAFLMRQLLKSYADRIAEGVKQTEALQAAKETAASLRDALVSETRAHSDAAQFRQEMTRAFASLEKTIEGTDGRRAQQHEDLRRLVLERTTAPGAQGGGGR